MAVLVAGCGYVGGALAQELLVRGDRVYGLRRDVSKLPVGVIRLSADLVDAQAVSRVLAPVAHDIDRLVYAASADERTEAAYRRTYVAGLDHVLRALVSAPLNRAVFTASTAVYGQQDGWVEEDSPTQPRSFTGRVLLEAEARLRQAPCRTVSLRLAGIYGPGRTRLVSQVEAGALGANRWTNRIHRDDCAGALAMLLRLEDPAPVYIGVDDAPAPLGEVAAFIAAELGVAPPRLVDPPSGKRCRNARLCRHYALRYPTYRDGYGAIVRQYRQVVVPELGVRSRKTST